MQPVPLKTFAAYDTGEEDLGKSAGLSGGPIPEFVKVCHVLQP